MPGKVTAFFDVDRTLLRCNSGSRWLSYLRRNGEISTWKALRAAAWLARYKLALIDMEAVTGIVVADMKGVDEAEMVQKTRRWLEEEILGEVAPRGREQIAWHRRQGHVTAILSTSTPYLTEPLAAHLGIDHVLCTRLEVNDGVFTGGWEPPLCYGPGKVTRASEWAGAHGIDLARSSFYTDSISDLPMLEAVGSPRVVNPDPRLRFVAARRRYPVESWK